MKYYILIAIVTLAAVLVSCGGKPKGTRNGKEVYDQYCNTCHGVDGKKGGSNAFDLSISKLEIEERKKVIDKGRNTMAAFGSLLTKEELQAVSEYVGTMKK